MFATPYIHIKRVKKDCKLCPVFKGEYMNWKSNMDTRKI